MAKFYIPKRIDLFPIIKIIDWQDTFLTLKTCSAPEIAEFQKKIKTVQKELDLLKEDPEVNQDLISAKETESFDVLLNFVKERFVKGVVFDSEKQEKVEITAEDISQFNLELLQIFIAEMFGQGQQLKKN